MTRDEATQKFYTALLYQKPPGAQVNSFNWCGGMVDALAAIGVLKIDVAPDNPLEALALSMVRAGVSGSLTAAKVHGYLEDLGFKVVKK